MTSQFMDMLTTRIIVVVAVVFWSSLTSSAPQRKRAHEEREEASFSVGDKGLLSKGHEVEMFKFIAWRLKNILITIFNFSYDLFILFINIALLIKQKIRLD